MSVVIRNVGSMDISIAYRGSLLVARGSWLVVALVARLPRLLALSRPHERKPRFRQLQFSGVQAARFEAGAEALQRVPRGNLRVPAPIREAGRFDAHLPRVKTFGFEACKPRPVDRLEWQAPLKTGL
jgi:hypothetical protein